MRIIPSNFLQKNLTENFLYNFFNLKKEKNKINNELNAFINSLWESDIDRLDNLSIVLNWNKLIPKKNKNVPLQEFKF